MGDLQGQFWGQKKERKTLPVAACPLSPTPPHPSRVRPAHNPPDHKTLKKKNNSALHRAANGWVFPNLNNSVDNSDLWSTQRGFLRGWAEGQGHQRPVVWHDLSGGFSGFHNCRMKKHRQAQTHLLSWFLSAVPPGVPWPWIASAGLLPSGVAQLQKRCSAGAGTSSSAAKKKLERRTVQNATSVTTWLTPPKNNPPEILFGGPGKQCLVDQSPPPGGSGTIWGECYLEKTFGFIGANFSHTNMVGIM